MSATVRIELELTRREADELLTTTARTSNHFDGYRYVPPDRTAAIIKLHAAIDKAGRA